MARRDSATVGMSYSRNRDNSQWYGNFDTLGTHYTCAHLEQRTSAITFRVDYTASPVLTLQVYASPFVSKGTYSNIRELANARAHAYADRYAAYFDTSVTNHPQQFNVKQFNSNVVLRWEYKPGSAIYAV